MGAKRSTRPAWFRMNHAQGVSGAVSPVAGVSQVSVANHVKELAIIGPCSCLRHRYNTVEEEDVAPPETFVPPQSSPDDLSLAAVAVMNNLAQHIPRESFDVSSTALSQVDVSANPHELIYQSTEVPFCSTASPTQVLPSA